MKINKDAVQALAAAIGELDTPQRRARYLAGDFPRADVVRDLNMRYRWDLLWEVRGFDIVYRHMPRDGSLTNAHVDTALRRVVPAL